MTIINAMEPFLFIRALSSSLSSLFTRFQFITGSNALLEIIKIVSFLCLTESDKIELCVVHK